MFMKAGKVIFQGKTKKGNEILIRYPLSTDVNMLHRYINTLSQEQTFIRFQGEEISIEEETNYLNSQIEKIEKGEAVKLFVFNNNELVAVSDIYLEDKISSHVGVFGITVAIEFRNEGIGKMLMELVLKEATENMPKLKIATLGVFSNNPLALEMYKKLSFREYGRLPKGVNHRGEFVDHIYMYKNI